MITRMIGMRVWEEGRGGLLRDGRILLKDNDARMLMSGNRGVARGWRKVFKSAAEHPAAV